MAVIDAMVFADLIKGAVAYCDQVELVFYPRVPLELIRRVRVFQSGIGSVFIRRRFSSRQPRPLQRRGDVLVITQPTPRTLRCLARHRYASFSQPTHAKPNRLPSSKPEFVVWRVDIAVDFLAETGTDALLISSGLKPICRLKWHGRQRASQCVDTVYSSQPKARRKFVLYADKPSKVTKSPCAHLEMRFQTSATCRNTGLGDLRALAHGIDAMELLKKNVALGVLDENALNRFIKKKARRLGGGNAWLGMPLEVREAIIANRIAALIQNDNIMPDPGSLEGTLMQDVYDGLRSLRRAVKKLDWEEIADPPEWQHHGE